MIRNKVSVTLPSNLVDRKFKEFHTKFLQVGSACLKEEMTNLAKNEPYHLETWNYLEDGTDEVRKVNSVVFGIPAQLNINFYM